MTPKNILYIHGFNSSPSSMKTQLTHQYLVKNNLDVKFYCPQLLSTPNEAIQQLENIIKAKPDDDWYLFGSSLGGYFATYLAEKYQIKAVLINPAIRPFELLVDYLGEQKNPYTDEVYQVTQQHISDLSGLFQEKINKKLYMTMVQTGDEVLDYQQAVDKFYQGRLIVQKGGDHGFVNYKDMLPEIVNFLHLF